MRPVRFTIVSAVAVGVLVVSAWGDSVAALGRGNGTVFRMRDRLWFAGSAAFFASLAALVYAVSRGTSGGVSTAGLFVIAGLAGGRGGRRGAIVEA